MASIVNFSEAASIAIHGMILIAKSDKYINVQEIAEKLGSSKHHVAKVMQRLTKEEYITSFRGPTGGFILLKKPNEITFLDIYETIEGRIKISTCPFENGLCGFHKCILNNVTSVMLNQFKDYMKLQTLDMFI